MEDHFQGLLLNDLKEIAPEAYDKRIERPGVVDAGGSPATLADETALRRMEKHSVTLTSTNQGMAELANSWSEGVGQTIQTILYQEILAKLVEA